MTNTIHTARSFFFYLVVPFLLLNGSAYSQSCIYPWSVETGIGISEYKGKAGNGLFKFDVRSHVISPAEDSIKVSNSPGIFYVAVNKSANPNLDFSAKIYHGEWGYYNSISQFYFFKAVTGLELTARWKFIGNYSPLFTPYLALGLGMRRIKMNGSDQYGFLGADRGNMYELNVPAGLGATVRIKKRVSLIMQSNLALPFSSNFSSGQSSYNITLNHTIGLIISLYQPTSCQSSRLLLCPPFGR